MSKLDDVKGKVEGAVNKVRDEYKDEAYEARDELKSLWAGNPVFRAAVIAAGVIVLIVLLAAA